MKSIPNTFFTTPIVYAVGKIYQIIVPVTCECVMCAEVGGERFYDDSNGILRSSRTTHIVRVPMELLNREKHYKLCYRTVSERKPYFTEPSEEMYYESDFRPIESETIRIYHIADAHDDVENAVKAGAYFGDGLDLLILNGDIPNHSGDIRNFTSIHRIAAELTNGEIPVVFSRGNHDMRGVYAEKLEEHTPTDAGRSYYTFRLGSLWGVVLDCAEDKPDDHAAYGFMNCCEDFRRRQTEFLREIVKNSKNEYEAKGVKNRIVVAHNPFTVQLEEPFNIEAERYSEWAAILKDHVKPQLMLCGHLHEAFISPVGGERDDLGQPCTLVVASLPKKKENYYAGGALTLTPERCHVVFNSNSGDVFLDEEIVF